MLCANPLLRARALINRPSVTINAIVAHQSRNITLNSTGYEYELSRSLMMNIGDDTSPTASFMRHILTNFFELVFATRLIFH